MDNKLNHFENAFFFVKLASTDQQNRYWEIVRKTPLTSGAKGELFEVISGCISENTLSYFIFDVEDYALALELTSLGGFRIGYLHEVISDGLQFELLAEDIKALVLPIEDLDSEKKNIRKNLYRIDELRHSLKVLDKLFLESFFKRDRLYQGISKCEQPVKNESKISEQQFADGPITPDQLEKILQNSLYRSLDVQFPYAQSGDLDLIQTQLIIKNVSNLQDGIYLVNHKSQTISFIKDFSHINKICELLFLPIELRNANVFVFFSLCFSEINKVHGQRSIRLALLTLGGTIQQLHQATSAEGLSFRTIGEFDELQCSNTLGHAAEENTYLTCAAVLGGALG